MLHSIFAMTSFTSFCSECYTSHRSDCRMVLQAAMQYTEAQQQDLMLLRRLFYGKLGVLARERKECLRRVPLGAAMTDHEVNSRLAEVVATAQELRDITAAEFQTKLQFTSAYRRGVSLPCPKSSSLPPPPPPLPPKPFPLARTLAQGLSFKLTHL